jgi:oligoribonuclease
MDLEMSGLDPKTCRILEIATIITDADLEVIAEGPDLVIHEPESVLESMDAWCIEHHGASGLSDQVRASTISLREAEERTLAFLREHCPEGASPLCGNSIGQDRRFLYDHMPTLESWLHYRSVDVSTIKELVRRWYPTLEPMTKATTHRALDDIRESIAELAHYRKSVFVDAI